MARILISDGLIKISREGFDPRTAIFDELILTTDYISDQIVTAGIASFGSGNSVTVTLPFGQTDYKIDFFYCDISGSNATTLYFPEAKVMAISGTRWQQLTVEISGLSAIFRRRGNIAGVTGKGVAYFVYSSPLG